VRGFAEEAAAAEPPIPPLLAAGAAEDAELELATAEAAGKAGIDAVGAGAEVTFARLLEPDGAAAAAGAAGAAGAGHFLSRCLVAFFSFSSLSSSCRQNEENISDVRSTHQGDVSAWYLLLRFQVFRGAQTRCARLL
jgi:hypothetical protein